MQRSLGHSVEKALLKSGRKADQLCREGAGSSGTRISGATVCTENLCRSCFELLLPSPCQHEALNVPGGDTIASHSVIQAVQCNQQSHFRSIFSRSECQHYRDHSGEYANKKSQPLHDWFWETIIRMSVFEKSNAVTCTDYGSNTKETGHKK